MEHFKFSCRGGNQRRDDNKKKKALNHYSQSNQKKIVDRKIKKRWNLKTAPLVIKYFIFQKNTSSDYYFIIRFTVFRADTMEQLSWLLSKGMYTILARILWELCWAATTTGKMIHDCS